MECPTFSQALEILVPAIVLPGEHKAHLGPRRAGSLPTGLRRTQPKEGLAGRFHVGRQRSAVLQGDVDVAEMPF